MFALLVRFGWVMRDPILPILLPPLLNSDCVAAYNVEQCTISYPEFSKYLCRVMNSDSLSPATTPYDSHFISGSSDAGSTRTTSSNNNHRHRWNASYANYSVTCPNFRRKRRVISSSAADY